MEEKRLRIGELLIEEGVLNSGKLREALEIQKRNPRPLGQILVETGFVTEAQLIQALSRQLSIPWVSLWHVDVAPELLSIVSREEAEKFRLLPIYARTVRGEKPALFVAMDDPTYQEALEFVREAAGMEVRPMIAAPTDLRQAIRALYAGEEEEEEEEAAPIAPPITGRRSSRPPPPPPRAAMLQPPAEDRFAVQAAADAAHDDALELTEPAGDDEEAAEPAAPAESALSAPDTDVGTRPSTEPPPAEPPPAAAPESASAPGAAAESEPAAPSFLVPGAIEGGATHAAALRDSTGAPDVFEQQEPPPAPVRKPRHALAFTFLDGTSIAIGAPPSPDVTPAVKLGELVRTLRHYSDDPNVPEPFGPRGLSRVVAAVLELLAKKSLISEVELAEAIGRPPQDR
jgi:hypothetical protein